VLLSFSAWAEKDKPSAPRLVVDFKTSSKAQWLRCRQERRAPLPRAPAENAHEIWQKSESIKNGYYQFYALSFQLSALVAIFHLSSESILKFEIFSTAPHFVCEINSHLFPNLFIRKLCIIIKDKKLRRDS
jgi:hypothetical protein